MIGTAQDYKTLVIGVGKTLRGDDGIGVAVARSLADYSLPEGVWVVDGGTEGLDLIFRMEEADRVVLIDAAEMGREVGEAMVLDNELLEKGVHADFSSTHGFGVAEVLALGRSVGVEPEVSVVAIQPEHIGPRDGLSDSLASRLPEYVELTKALLEPEAG